LFLFLFLVLPFVRFVSILFFSFVSVFFPLVFSMFFSVLSPLFSFGWFLCFSFCLRPLLLLRVCLLPFRFCLFRGGGVTGDEAGARALVGQCFSFCFCVSTSCLSPVLVFVRPLVFSPCPCVFSPPFLVAFVWLL